MSYSPDDRFRKLYDAYTGPDSTGLHLTRHVAKLTQQQPLLVVTGSDYVLFPGTGRPPLIESFRLSTRGFVELTAISHLGAAVAWIFELRELGHNNWREDAERLIERTRQVRSVNTEAYWIDNVAVAAWTGQEARIADLVDYTCATTIAFLTSCLDDEGRMTFENLRALYLDPVNSKQVPVPIDDVMVATFALTFLDIAHRIVGWLRAQDLAWENLTVLLSGRSGRPTAGLTWATNNACHLIWRASEKKLPVENLHIAPHGPSLAIAELSDAARAAEIEAQYREVFGQLRSNIDLARKMFEGFPAFARSIEEPPVIAPNTRSLQAMPGLRSPDDRVTAITRLRFVMEDPAQLLSNSVAHYVIDQLCDHDNRPGAVIVPGFTNTTYPPRQRS